MSGCHLVFCHAMTGIILSCPDIYLIVFHVCHPVLLYLFYRNEDEKVGNIFQFIMVTFKASPDLNLTPFAAFFTFSKCKEGQI